ncbi:MAG: hypothetical protein J6K03_01230 [Oscillospiraceae bacterium]|nr:hypothetical protein [Oscillospiraceae bacterium]
MGRRSYIVKAGGGEFKLRLTLAGQKNLMAKNPDVSVMALVMSAIDDPQDMENLLTEALNWEGSENAITEGAKLYDLMVDDGKCGTDHFADLVLNIAHNAGLINDDERKQIYRGIVAKFKKGIDSMFGEEPEFFDLSEDEEGGEGSDNPQMTMQTL